jgi:cell fate regulator YaaT (PSP1 superfamily)
MSDMVRQRTVAGVRFSKVGKLYHFEYSEYPELQVNDYVIVETLRGRQMGQIMAFAEADAEREHKPIMRPASPRDLVLKQEWEAKEPEALVICRETAQKLGGFGDAKFVAAQYNYDGSHLTFLFSSEQKVNTTKLVTELSKQFDSQIEMRQIGPRDVAKLLGGFGACGILRCCSTFLTDFSPISIKMAKVQGISLNPSEITGMCGRLRCCLVYEYEQYVEARKQLPKRNKRVGTPAGAGKVIDVYPLLDSVVVYIEGEGRVTVKREELIPLDELEALEKKAKEPCTKHGEGEACDCGQKPGTRNQDIRNQELRDQEARNQDAIAQAPQPAESIQDVDVSQNVAGTDTMDQLDQPNQQKKRRDQDKRRRRPNKKNAKNAKRGADNNGGNSSQASSAE